MQKQQLSSQLHVKTAVFAFLPNLHLFVFAPLRAKFPAKVRLCEMALLASTTSIIVEHVLRSHFVMPQFVTTFLSH